MLDVTLPGFVGRCHPYTLKSRSDLVVGASRNTSCEECSNQPLKCQKDKKRQIAKMMRESKTKARPRLRQPGRKRDSCAVRLKQTETDKRHDPARYGSVMAEALLSNINSGHFTFLSWKGSYRKTGCSFPRGGPEMCCRWQTRFFATIFSEMVSAGLYSDHHSRRALSMHACKDAITQTWTTSALSVRRGILVRVGI